MNKGTNRAMSVRGRISLILPYWDRQAVADMAMQWLALQYGWKRGRRTLPLEVIVIDDGSTPPFTVSDAIRQILDVQVLQLPMKAGPLSASVPINRGVDKATGEYIALSCVEMLHNHGPILSQMRQELRALGPMGYVSAAVWCPEKGGRWHSHSSMAGPRNVHGVPLPVGGQYNFMTMMHRTLWDEARGFDERYRHGAGYDDTDFLKRLEKLGAQFRVLDELVVEHVREGAHAAWTAEMFERNKRLFAQTWGGKL